MNAPLSQANGKKVQTSACSIDFTGKAERNEDAAAIIAVANVKQKYIYIHIIINIERRKKKRHVEVLSENVSISSIS